jgi:predicted Zn-dependent protease
MKYLFGGIALAVLLLFASCASGAGAAPSADSGRARATGYSYTAEIEALIFRAEPESLIKAIQLIADERIGGTEFGREMLFLAGRFYYYLYPDIPVSLPDSAPPASSVYVKIFKAVEDDLFWEGNDTSFGARIAPLFILVANPKADPGAKADLALSKAKAMGVASVLPNYLSALLAERRGNLSDSMAYFRQVISFSPSCYPAAIGLSRCQIAQGLLSDAIATLSGLIASYPNNIAVKKSLGEAYYLAGDFERAGPLITQVLVQDPDDYRFIIMRARILIEQKSYSQAEQLLDAFASYNPNDKTYIILRARLYAEYQRENDAALDTLKVGLGIYPDDKDLLVLAAQYALASGKLVDARGYIEKALAALPNDLGLHALLAQVCLATKDYARAKKEVDYLLANRQEKSDLELAYKLAAASGDKASREKYARALYEGDPANEGYSLEWIGILIEKGETAKAQELIAKALAGKGSAKYRSALFFYKSRLDSNDEQAMNDLRTSLLENPQNFDAILAMYDLYYKTKDYRKAQYYLKQALALDPAAPGLATRQQQLSMVLPNG